MAPHGTDDHDETQVPPPEPPPAPEVSRRAFLQTVGAAGAAGAAGVAGGGVAQGVAVSAQARPAQAPPAQGANTAPVERPYMRIRQEVAENLVKRGIVGYADRLSVQPGETIRFMVSSELPRYRADIVRLIHGDAEPDRSGHQGRRSVETPANGEYPGKRQELPLGSYVIVPDIPRCASAAASRFTAWIAPTSQRGVIRPMRSSASRACSPSGRAPTRRLRHLHRRRGPAGALARRRRRADRKLAARAAAPAVGAGDPGHERPAAGGDHGLVFRRRHASTPATGQGRAPPGSARTRSPFDPDARAYRAHGRRSGRSRPTTRRC